jgi:hypothetical protein
VYDEQVEPQRRSFDDIAREVDEQAAPPLQKRSAPRKQRPSFDEIEESVYGKRERYGPEISASDLGDTSSQSSTSQSSTAIYDAYRPKRPSISRGVEAARTARQINDLKDQSVALFQRADKEPGFAVDGGLSFGQQLRAQAEGKLEQANMLAKDAQRKYANELEIGFGEDADKKSGRQWAYAKVKPHAADALVEQDRMRMRDRDAQLTKALDVTPEDVHRHEIQRQREQVESEWLPTRWARRFVTAAAGGLNPDEEVINQPVGRVDEAINSTLGAATRGMASLPEGAARIWDSYANKQRLLQARVYQDILNDPNASPERKSEAQAGLKKAYDSLSNVGDRLAPLTQYGEDVSRSLYPLAPKENTINPTRADFWSRTLPEAAGSMLPFMASGAVGSAANLPAELVAGAAGAAMEVPGQYREAKEAGANPLQLQRATETGMLAGGLESLGAESLMGKLPGKGRLGHVLKEAAQEGVQEGAQQFVENVGAKYYSQHDPNRALSKDVLENAVPALFLGGAGGAGSHVAEAQHAQTQTRAIQNERAAMPNIVPTAGAGATGIFTKEELADTARRLNVPQDAQAAHTTATTPVNPTAAPTVTTSAPDATGRPLQLFPEAVPTETQQQDLSALSPQERVAAMLTRLKEQQEGRKRTSLEQDLNKEFGEAGAMVNAAAQSWDTDRVTAEQLATVGAQRLKTALSTLQKSEAYQMELASVAQGTAQPGPYITAARTLQQQLDQASNLFNLDAERERQAAQQQADAERAQVKANKEAAKQTKFESRQQAKTQRVMEIEQRRAEIQNRRDEAVAQRMQAAEKNKAERRAQLEQQRQQARDERERQRADAVLQRMQRHDAALQAADNAGRRHQEFLNQGMVPEAISELVVQQNQIKDAVRMLPATPESQAIKADLNRYQGQIGNRIGDLRKQASGRTVPVTQAIPPLFQPDAVVNPSGTVPQLQSFYEPGSVFDRVVPTMSDAEDDSTPMLTAIRRAGGIANDSISPGELRRLGVKESGTTGLVNNKGGLAPDRMREAMVEAGYLPEDSTVDDLFQAIEGEIRSGRGARPSGSIGEFFNQWEAESQNEDEGDYPEREPLQHRKTIADFFDEFEKEGSVPADELAGLKRTVRRATAENPRNYDERTRHGEPGSSGVSFSPYADLEGKVRGAEQQLYDSEPGSESFRQAEQEIYQAASRHGIEERHADAMIAYALNWHGQQWLDREFEQTDYDDQSLHQMAGLAERVADDSAITTQRIFEIGRQRPPLERTQIEREVAAIDDLKNDVNMRILLAEAADGDENARQQFFTQGDEEYGVPRQTLEELIRSRQQARSIPAIGGRTVSQSDAARPGREASPTGRQERGSEGRTTSADAEASHELLSRDAARQPTEREIHLLKIRPSEVFDKDFDAYMTEVEDLYRRAVQGEVDIDPKAIYDFTKWTGVSAEDVDELRAAGENAGPLAKIRGNRHKRVEENRLPARQNVEIINEYKNADLDQLAIPSREGRKSQLDQVIQATSVTLDKNPSGVSSAWMAEVRRLHERAIAARERYQSRERDAKTVTHSNPAIDGKPVLAETADGRVVVANPDNQTGVSVVKPQLPRETAKPTSERGRLAQAVAAHLADGKKFANIVEARKFVAEQTGRDVKPGSLETKQVDEAIEAGAVLAARQIVARRESPEATFQAIRELYDRLPNLSARTSTSIRQQAYSTPLPLAYVASELAGISSQTTVYEPSAGHSALLLAAEPSKVVANELNAERAATVRDLLPGATVTEHNAAEWKPDQKVDRVIANPPFGIVKDEAGNTLRFEINRKYQTSEIDHAIAFEALKAMKDDGKAVLIVGAPRAESLTGRSDAYNSGAKRSFYFTLYNQYNVTDHFTVLGALYQKQGAGWPVDVIVIEGRGRSQRALPAADVPATLRSWDEIGEKLASRSGQNAGTIAVDNARLGERGLPARERNSGASQRTVDDVGLHGVPARPSAEDVGARGTSQGVGTVVSGEPTGRSESAERTPQPARSERSVESVDLQQRTPARSAEQSERLSGQNNAEQGQSARETVDRGDQPGAVGQRADSGTGRASDVDSVFDEEFAKLFGTAAPDNEQPYTRKQFDADVSALNKEVQDYKRSLRDESASQSTGDQPPRTAKETAKPAAAESPKPAPKFQPGQRITRKDSGQQSSTTYTVVSTAIRNGKESVEIVTDLGRNLGWEPVRHFELAEPPRTTKEAAKSAATESKDTLKEIAKGLSELFGGPSISSGLPGGIPAFDEKTYAAAKPHFEAAMKHFQQATRDVREVISHLLKELNERFNFQPDVIQRMKPYIVRFVEEQTGQSNTAPKSSFTESAIEQATQTPATTTGEADSGASDTHRAYQPASGQKSVGTLVPVNMAAAVENSLKRLKEEVGDLDAYVGEKLGYKPDEIGKYLSGEQVDAVAMAVRNIEQGGALILGDQTGIGKGRVVAAVIRYANRQKLTPVFVTEKPTLYGDMIRDLTDIGSEDLKPLITNAGESVPLDDEALEWYGAAEKAKLLGQPSPAKRGKFLQTQPGKAHEAALRQAAETGNLNGHQVIFTTYNQMQSVQGRLSARHDLLRRFANNGIVIFDESHNAGGAGQVEMDEKGKPQFNRAQFAREMAKNAKGVLYSSATFAKRPEVMDLYFRTELGKAVGDLSELAEITQKGGVPMQQVIASMLAESGQYIRRERSFKGVEYAPTPTTVDRTTAENVSKAMREVAAFDRIKQAALKTLNERVKAEAKRITVDGSVGQAGVSSVNFTSLMHNLIEQSLLALKADQAAETAIRALEAGEKPVITVANTMGSFIQRFAEDNELQPGAPINLSFNDLLNRYLERSREVVIGKPYGEKTRHYLSDEELGEEGVDAYKQAAKTLEKLNLDIPISPIDWLHKRLRDAGYRTGEITGRGHVVNYTNDGATYATRPASETSTAAKKRTIAAFNDGAMDVLILNQSGSTGISLHSSEKFKDQRRRHMIIAQAEKNIDTHMQMLGRVHRTGQVVAPRYTQMVADIPAELRPAAVLAKKMASLNANTTASRSSAVTAKDVPDFLNKYGDEVAASLMESNPELHEALGYPLKDSERSEGLEREDAMRKVTGRVPLLTIAEQERVYQELTDEYEDTLRQAEAMGENALEAKTLNLDAETVKSQPLVAGSGSSLFEQAATLERIRANRQGRPLTSDEVMDRLKASLGDAETLPEMARKGRAQIRDTGRGLADEVAAFKLKMEEEHGDSKRGQLEQLAADKWLNRWQQIAGTVYPGATVSIAGGYGVVLSVERKGKRANPVALSGWRATVALADSRRQLTVALSKIDFGESDTPNRVVVRPAQEATTYDPAREDFVRLPILEAFDKGLATTKENRYMVTGNLIAGFGAAPNGQIVNFTSNEGQIRQGILMPSSFDPAEAVAKQKQRLKTVDEVMRAVNEGRGAQVTDRTGDLTISKGIDGYVFSVPAAKGRGGKYYLNSALLKAAGMDFAKRGGLMEVQVDAFGARRMVDALLKGDGLPSGVSLQTKAPKVAERRGDAAFTGRYTVSDLATNATAEYRPARNRPGTVYLNEWGHALVRDSLVTTFGESVSGIPGDFTLDSESVRHAAEAMRERAGGAFAQIAAELDTAADDADANGRDVAIVTKRAGQAVGEIKQAVRHETTHTAQSAVDQTLTGAATEAWLAKQPNAQRIRAELARRGYADETHGYEAVAYIASGDFGIFGLSLDEAAQVMNSYYRATVQKFGARSLEKFGAIDPKLQPVLEGARRNETQSANAIAEGSAEVAGRGNRGTESQTGRGSEGVANSPSGGRGQAEGVPRIAERKERGRFSFGELEHEPTGTVLGSGLGGLQAKLSAPQPKTTPLRQIVAEHRPLQIDPYEIQNRAIKEILDAGGRGVAGSLPGARALYWAQKLKAKPLADKLASRQAQFIEDAITHTNEIIHAWESMQAAERGSVPYQNAKRDLYQSRRQLHAMLQRVGEYSGPVEYLTKYAKSAVLTAPHILTNNVLDHLASFPFHEAQKMIGFLMPVKALRRWGVNVERTPLDFRDLVPALGREFFALAKGTKDAMPDFVHALKYGTTDILLDEQIAHEQAHQADDEVQTGGADRYEMGKRAKLIPGLDQVLTAIGRAHGAVDVAGRRWAFATAIASQANSIAKRIGEENGFSQPEIEALRNDLAYEPSPQMILLAMDEANRFVLDYPTFLHEMIKKARGVGKEEFPLANKAFNNALDFVVKFQKIPLAAQAQSLWHYSPLGLPGQVNRVFRARRAQQEGKPISARQSAEIVERLQQGVLGTMVWAGVGLLGTLGYLQFTGGDDRQRVRNTQEAMGYGYDPELFVGNTALTLNKLGVVGRAASTAARIAKAAESRVNPKTGEPESDSTLYKRVGKAFMKGVVFDNPIGRGVGELITSDTGDPLENFARSQIRSLQPGVLRDIAKLQDGTRRMPDQTDFASKVKADLKTGNPWYRQELQPRLDALGQPVEEDNPFLFHRTVTPNPQLEEMTRLGTGLSKLKRDRGESASDYNEQIKEQGSKTQAALQRLKNDAQWPQRSDSAKARIYDQSLTPGGMERAAKLSNDSVEAERDIESLRSDAYQMLRTLPAYQKLSEENKKAVRQAVDEQLKQFRARAQSQHVSRYGRPFTVREHAARAPGMQPLDVARQALRSAEIE